MNISNNYQDNDIVCKFGFTDDFERRTKEHIKTYGKINNANLHLLKYANIDASLISNAEVNVKNLFKQYFYDYHNHKEIVIINNDMLKTAYNTFELINRKYIVN